MPFTFLFIPHFLLFVALDLLSRANGTLMEAGIQKAKDQIMSIVAMAQAILDSKQVHLPYIQLKMMKKNYHDYFQ